MKTITFDHIRIDKPQQDASKPPPRNEREDLIEQIVAQCHHKRKGDDRKLTRLPAVTANAAGWTVADLHGLLKKRHEPRIRNYAAFVWWSAKLKKHGK